jgi:hypothetical protein
MSESLLFRKITPEPWDLLRAHGAVNSKVWHGVDSGQLQILSRGRRTSRAVWEVETELVLPLSSQESRMWAEVDFAEYDFGEVIDTEETD